METAERGLPLNSLEFPLWTVYLQAENTVVEKRQYSVLALALALAAVVYIVHIMYTLERLPLLHWVISHVSESSLAQVPFQSQLQTRTTIGS